MKKYHNVHEFMEFILCGILLSSEFQINFITTILYRDYTNDAMNKYSIFSGNFLSVFTAKEKFKPEPQLQDKWTLPKYRQRNTKAQGAIIVCQQLFEGISLTAHQV